MKLRTRSLVARIVGYFLLLSLIATTIVPVASFFLARQALQRSVFERLEVAATLKENELNRWVEDNQADILFIAQSPEFSSQAWRLLTVSETSPEYRVAYSALSNYLASLLGNKTNLLEVFIMTAKGGQVVLSTDKTREGDYRATDTYYTQGRLGTYVQNVYTSPVTGKPTMTISTPLFDPTTNSLAGVLAAHLNLERLDSIILERAGLGETGETYLVSQYGSFVSEARFAGEEFARGVHTEGIDQALEGMDGFGTYENYQGTPVLGVYRWLDERSLALVAEISQEEAYAPAARLAGTIFLLSLVSAGLLAGGAYLVARQIARPILAINEVAGYVAKGDLSHQAVVLTQDEIGTLATTFNEMTRQLREQLAGLEERVGERTRELQRRAVQLQAAAEVGSAVASVRDLSRLLQDVTHLISERFGYYHVGIFLIDESGTEAVLRAANSPGGLQMLARGHRLKVGQKGIVGYVTGQQKPRIAMDVGQDAVYFDNPDLPETRSEMALPLVAGGQLLGVLDVQSKEEMAFSQEDIETLQVLADQVAVAIENANLFSETQAALDASRRAYGEISRQAWGKILAVRPDLGYLCDRRGRTKPASGKWSGELAAAQTSGRVTQVEDRTVIVPFKVHGQTLGVARLRKPEDAGEWTKKEIDLMESLASNLGESLESAQLYNDSQRRAVREQLVGEVTSAMRESLDVDTVLRTAAQQIRRALNLATVEVRLGASVSEAAPGDESSGEVSEPTQDPMTAPGEADLPEADGRLA